MDTFVSMSVYRRVVEAGSFSAVARAMGPSRPTVSKHIAALEKCLGTRLLNRSTRQLNSINNPDAVREAALAGMGVAVVPLWLIQGDVERGALKIVLGDYKPVSIEIHAAFPDRRFVPGKVRTFIDHVRSTLDASTAYVTG